MAAVRSTDRKYVQRLPVVFRRIIEKKASDKGDKETIKDQICSRNSGEHPL